MKTTLIAILTLSSVSAFATAPSLNCFIRNEAKNLSKNFVLAPNSKGYVLDKKIVLDNGENEVRLQARVFQFDGVIRFQTEASFENKKVDLTVISKGEKQVNLWINKSKKSDQAQNDLVVDCSL